MGKRLAMNMVRKQRDLASPSDPTYSFPVVTSTKIQNAINRLITPNGSAPNPGIEIRESRPYNPQELSDLRNDFAQNGATDAQYMIRL